MVKIPKLETHDYREPDSLPFIEGHSPFINRSPSKDNDLSWNTNFNENKFSLSITKIEEKKEVAVGRSTTYSEASPVKWRVIASKIKQVDLDIK